MEGYARGAPDCQDNSRNTARPRSPADRPTVRTTFDVSELHLDANQYRSCGAAKGHAWPQPQMPRSGDQISGRAPAALGGSVRGGLGELISVRRVLRSQSHNKTSGITRPPIPNSTNRGNPVICPTSQSKFCPKNPVMKVRGRNTVARIVSRSILALGGHPPLVC